MNVKYNGSYLMETFQINTQRNRHPNLNIYSYVSKALKVKSRLAFFLIAKTFSQRVKKLDVTL